MCESAVAKDGKGSLRYPKSSWEVVDNDQEMLKSLGAVTKETDDAGVAMTRVEESVDVRWLVSERNLIVNKLHVCYRRLV